MTLYTLDMQCQLKAAIEKPYFKSSAPARAVVITSSIDVKSKTYEGKIEINFTKEAFLDMVGAMFGEKPNEVTPDLIDAAKETVNIIIKQTAIELRNQGFSDVKNMAFTVEIGDSKPKNQSVIVIPLKVNTGFVTIEVPV